MSAAELLIGFMLGLLCYWRYRQVTRAAGILEISGMTEIMATRMKRWGIYWAAISANQRPYLADEATEIIEETHQAFEDALDIVKRVI